MRMNDEVLRRRLAFERERTGVTSSADQSEQRKVCESSSADHVLCPHDTLECTEQYMRIRFWIEPECGAAPFRRKQSQCVRWICGHFVVAHGRDDFVLRNGCKR